MNNLPKSSGGKSNKPDALITGAAGFIGRALARILRDGGARVVGIDLAPQPGSGRTEYRQADVQQYHQLLEAMQALPLEDPVVFHLAGQSNVSKARSEPLVSWSVNVSGTLNLLEACRQVGIRRVIFPSTVLVYARPAPQPLSETDPTAVTSIYSATKLACEALMESFSVDFGFTCRVARVGNVYGPGAPNDSVMNRILRQVISGEKISLRTLSPRRDFIYREDVASGLIAMAQHMDQPGFEIFNLASGESISIRELVETACGIRGIEPHVIESAPGKTGDEDQLRVSILRLAQRTGWRPSWTLQDGLRSTIFAMEKEMN